MSEIGDINFFNESTKFILRNKIKLRRWLLICAGKEKYSIGELNYIFCSDNYLRKINKQYLNHDYFTDIITFSTSEPGDKRISGDIFISIVRVRENAKSYKASVSDELHRVMIHGLLHLCCYNDKSQQQKNKMRKAENMHLTKINF